MAYTDLLAHLHRPSEYPPPLPSFPAALSHHLAHSGPSPTPLAASVLASPLFTSPLALQSVRLLPNAFRAAVLAKHARHAQASAGWFSPSPLDVWTRAILTGLRGGEHPTALPRLASLSGVLQGLEALRVEIGAKANAQDGVVLALAEVLETVPSVGTSRPRSIDDRIRLALDVFANVQQHVPSHKLSALPLSITVDALVAAIDSALHNALLGSPTRSASSTSGLATQDLSSVAPLSRLLSRVLTDTASLSRPQPLLQVCTGCLKSMEELAIRVVGTYGTLLRGHASPATTTRSLGESSASTVTSDEVWSALKTLLFAAVMRAQAVLSTAAYMSPVAYHDSVNGDATDIALSVLGVFNSLAFVISQFGGVGAQGSFIELKRAFYAAIDVLAAEPSSSERFIQSLLGSFEHNAHTSSSSSSTQTSKGAYALACVEQLVPTLSEGYLEDVVLPFTLPFLYDAADREIFESAHSVILALFADASRRKHLTLSSSEVGRKSKSGKSPVLQSPFTDRLVPFYLECIISNAEDGKLNSVQLRLAYGALVACACASSATLGRLCLERVLDELPSKRETDNASSIQAEDERVRRLREAFVGAVGTLPLALLPKALDDMHGVLLAAPADQRAALSGALLEQIVAHMGDAEKAAGMRWWYAHRRELVAICELNGGGHSSSTTLPVPASEDVGYIVRS